MPVKLIGLEKGEENLVVGGGVVHGVAGDSCHRWKMLAGEVSVVVDATYEDDYEIYRPINNDDPPITRMEQCVGMFIVWDSACMRLVPHAVRIITLCMAYLMQCGVCSKFLMISHLFA